MHGHVIPLNTPLPGSSRTSSPGAARTQRAYTGRILAKGEHLYHEGGGVPGVYMVITGALKGYKVDEDGSERVMRLYCAGDVLGFEGLAQREALVSVVAVDTAKVWKVTEQVPVDEQPESLDVTEIVLMGFYRELSLSAQVLEMNRGSAEARLARFLGYYGEQQAQRGCKQQEFLLPFGRRDVANYLGIAPETLSRAFSGLRDKHILEVSDDHVVVLDPAALRRIAHGNA